MVDEKTLAEINGPYICPPDAGPEWRAACEYGFDMSLVEGTLRRTPEERLDEHQRALNLVLQIIEAREENLQRGAIRESTSAGGQGGKTT